jgi:hypothetical protein
LSTYVGRKEALQSRCSPGRVCVGSFQLAPCPSRTSRPNWQSSNPVLQHNSVLQVNFCKLRSLTTSMQLISNDGHCVKLPTHLSAMLQLKTVGEVVRTPVHILELWFPKLSLAVDISDIFLILFSPYRHFRIASYSSSQHHHPSLFRSIIYNHQVIRLVKHNLCLSLFREKTGL